MVQLSLYRVQLYEYLQNRMRAIAPNLTTMVLPQPSKKLKVSNRTFQTEPVEGFKQNGEHASNPVQGYLAHKKAPPPSEINCFTLNHEP